MPSNRGASTRTLFRPVAGLVVMLLVTLGCQERGDVSGKVIYQNKALKFGTVLIEGSDGGRGQGMIALDGSYFIPAIRTGKVRVAVNSPNPKAVVVISKDPNRKPEGYSQVSGWFPIPQQYGDANKSGLIYTIKRGANNIDIELK